MMSLFLFPFKWKRRWNHMLLFPLCCSWSVGKTRPRSRSWTIWHPRRRITLAWESIFAPWKWCPVFLTWVSLPFVFRDFLRSFRVNAAFLSPASFTDIHKYFFMLIKVQISKYGRYYVSINGNRASVWRPFKCPFVHLSPMCDLHLPDFMPKVAYDHSKFVIVFGVTGVKIWLTVT